MRIDDSPADFLFGNINPIDEGSHELQLSNKLLLKLNVHVFLSGVLNFVFISLFLLSISKIDLGLNNFALGIIFIAGISSIASFKSKALLNRYGQDLVPMGKENTMFIFFQQFMSLVLLGLFYALLIFILNAIGYSENLYAQLGVIIFLIILYSKLMADIGLISSGLGKGIVPSWGGIRQILHHFKEISEINGKMDYQLITLRLGIILLIYSIVQTQIYVLLPILGLIYAMLYYNLERINASSILMKVRAKINIISPSIIPQSDFTDVNSLNILSGTLQVPIKPLITNTNKSMFVQSEQTLKPLATKSIFRIVNDIIKENNNNCQFCDSTEYINPNCNFCQSR